MKPTPGHQHVRRVYSRMKDLWGSETLIILRIGDHYELYFDDALTAAPLLNIGLPDGQVVGKIEYSQKVECIIKTNTIPKSKIGKNKENAITICYFASHLSPRNPSKALSVHN